MTKVPTTFLFPAPAYQHPVGRLMHSGASALSNAELLAAIIRTGTPHEDALHLAERILAKYDGLQGLAKMNASELNRIDGLGGTKVAQIAAALELSRRLAVTQHAEHPLVRSGADAAALVADMAALRQEHVRVLLLDSALQIIDMPTIYIGTANVTVLRVAEVFRQAVASGSSAIILAHNHPSGNPMPSPEDVELTRALANAGRLLDITLVDHIIVGRERWVSMREQGFLD